MTITKDEFLLEGRNLGKLIEPGLDPSAPAFIGLDGTDHERHYDYGEVDARADAFARTLLAQQVAIGDRVALLAENSVTYIIALLGILRAGAVAVPVNFRFPDELIAHVVADSGARLLLADSERRGHVPPGVPVWDLDESGFAARSRPQPDASPFPAFVPGPDDAALMLYTSGSTGRPKGVLLSHRSHVWVALKRRASTPLAGETVLIAAPLYHMNALALAFFVLAAHASAVLLPRFRAASYIRAITRHRCTWLTAVPPMIAMMLREKQELVHADLGSVRVVRMGSAPVSAALRTQIGQLLPNARIVNAYGTTESSPIAFGPHPDGLPVPPQAIGYPQPGVDARLRDAEGHLADEGVLELRSAGLMLGYHNRPDLKPFTDDGYYVTGDIFERDAQGFYTFVGRRDDMFVSGGENLYPGEIERVLERFPAVLQACVVPVPDDIKGTKPGAFVVLRPDAAMPSAAEIQEFSLQHLPAYAHPRWVWFVDALPLAATQKIDRRKLLADAAQRVAATPPKS